MASTTANLTTCRTLQVLARIITAAFSLFGIWALVICLAFRQISPVLLPVAALAFLGAPLRIRLNARNEDDSAGTDFSHAIILASSLAFSPLGGVIPAAFSYLGQLFFSGNYGSLQKRQVPVLPAAAASAGLACHLVSPSPPASSSIWTVVSCIFAVSAYFTVYYAAGYLKAITAGDTEELSVSCKQDIFVSAAAGYPLSVMFAASPVHTAFSAVLMAVVTLIPIRTKAPVSELSQEHPLEIEETVDENDDHEESKEKPSLLDPLTGVANLKYLLMFLEQEISRSGRNGHPLSLLLLDIDGLNGINDTLGRHVGDDLLKLLARELKAALRDYDLVARYSEDEFALVLPETSADNACDIAERIHRSITARSYSDTEGQEFKVQVSIGIASYPSHGEGSEELISSAHHALNRAKFTGPNRVQSCHKLAKAG